MKKPKEQNTIKYVCSKCGAIEDIPEDVIEYFDEINPVQLVFGAHQFTCKKCGNGIMIPGKEPGLLVKVYGIFQGLE